MTQSLQGKIHKTMATTLAVSLLLGAGLGPVFAAAAPANAQEKPPAVKGEPATPETGDTKTQLLEMTGGKRVKVVWNQETSPTNPKLKVRYYDSKKGAVVDLPFPEAGSAPLFTMDGRRIVISAGKTPAERLVLMYDTETGKLTELAKGLENNVMALWQDPKTKRDWVFVNDMGDKNQQWNQPAGTIYKYPVDKPEQRKLVWDRTSSQIYLSLSADGTRACLNPTWGNIGELKFALNADGSVDQTKSVFTKFGGGCWPSMAPDDSYRLFRLEGSHTFITMHDADNASKRVIPINEMLTGKDKGMPCWLTRWSTHPRYITCQAPNRVKDARIWVGKFDEKFTKIEKWVRIATADDAHCWQSHSWVE
jgi:hypothetical protein